jgi:hypothetical protein
MVGGTIFGKRSPPQVIQREISRALVLNLSLARKAVPGTAQDTFVLDRAFSLIEGHPAFCRSHPRLVPMNTNRFLHSN